MVTFHSTVAKAQIDYLLLRKGDRGLCKDCNVISSENLTIQHKLLMMDGEIKRDRRKKTLYDQPRIKWGDLTHALSWVMGEKLSGIGACSNSGDVNNMWDKTANGIRNATTEVLAVSKSNFGGNQGDWLWNEEVQGKVEAKKVAYTKLVSQQLPNACMSN